MAAEPDDQSRSRSEAQLVQQWLETGPLLSSAVLSAAAPVTLEALLRSPGSAGITADELGRATDPRTAHAAAVAAVELSSTEIAAQASERRVLLEERLLRAVALGRRLSEPLVPARPVLRLCCRLLARTLAERAPGRSVELRVPPHVAVQCVEGPRHTRGTPPNVVEADPLAFLDVAIGCRDWFEAVRSGGIRASGERADLRPWLPLLAEPFDGAGGP